jgi:hypothetical protein
LLLAILFAPAAACAQSQRSISDANSSSPSALNPAPADVPAANRLSRVARGLNAEFSFTGLHDSQTGYATLFTSTLGYEFNNTFSAEVSFPLYLHRLAPNQQTTPPPPPTQLLVARTAEPGDTEFSFSGQWGSNRLLYSGTFSLTAPSGDSTYGLSTGKPTFDYNNRFESTHGRFTPEIEFGIGDSSELATQNITKNYTSLGALSHYMAGGSVELPLGVSFSLDAYEELPIGDQKIYSTVRRGRVNQTVVSGFNLTEDNGFINAVDIPLGRRVFLSGYYSRSLRQHTDYVGASISFTLRGQPKDDLEDNVAALFR